MDMPAMLTVRGVSAVYGTVNPPMRGEGDGMSELMMCPYCGALGSLRYGLTRTHHLSDREPGDPSICPGSEQNPRNPRSDRRRLWNGKPNPHAESTP